MSIEDQAINVLENRCRYCGVAPDELHDKHCNVLLDAKITDLISNLCYALNGVSNKIDIVAREVQGVGNLISENANYDMFLRHKP